MKKNIFLLISSIVFTNSFFAMEEPVRAPIPQKVDILTTQEQHFNFNAIYDTLRNPGTTLQQAKAMGFTIDNIIRAKKMCDRDKRYAIPVGISHQIEREELEIAQRKEEAKKEQKSANITMIKNYIENNIKKNIKFGQIEQELLDAKFKKEDIEKVEREFKKGQLDLIYTFIDTHIQNKNWRETEQELLQSGFKREHIFECKAKRYAAITKAELQQIKDYTNNNLYKKDLNEIEQELITSGYKKEQIKKLKKEDEQTTFIKNFFEANRSGKTDKEVEKELLDKGFKKEHIEKVVKKQNKDRLNWLEKFEAPTNTQAKKKAESKQKLSKPNNLIKNKKPKLTLQGFNFSPKKKKTPKKKPVHKIVDCSQIKDQRKKELCKLLNIGKDIPFEDLTTIRGLNEILNAIEEIKPENVANQEIVNTLLIELLLNYKYLSYHRLRNAGYTNEQIIQACKLVKPENIANKNFTTSIIREKFEEITKKHNGCPEKEMSKVYLTGFDLCVPAEEIKTIEAKVRWNFFCPGEPMPNHNSKVYPKKTIYKKRRKIVPNEKLNNNKGLLGRFFNFFTLKQTQVAAYCTMFVAASSLFALSVYNLCKSKAKFGF